MLTAFMYIKKAWLAFADLSPKLNVYRSGTVIYRINKYSITYFTIEDLNFHIYYKWHSKSLIIQMLGIWDFQVNKFIKNYYIRGQMLIIGSETFVQYMFCN